MALAPILHQVVGLTCGVAASYWSSGNFETMNGADSSMACVFSEGMGSFFDPEEMMSQYNSPRRARDPAKTTAHRKAVKFRETSPANGYISEWGTGRRASRRR